MKVRRHCAMLLLASAAAVPGCAHMSPLNTDIKPAEFDRRVADRFHLGMSPGEVERLASAALLDVREAHGTEWPAVDDGSSVLSASVQDTSYLSNDLRSPGWGSLDFYFSNDALVAVRYADPNTLAPPEGIERRREREIPLRHRAHRDPRVEPSVPEPTP